MKAIEFTTKPDGKVISERTNNFVMYKGILHLAPPMEAVEAQMIRAQRMLEETNLVDAAGLPVISEDITIQKRNKEIQKFLAMYTKTPEVGKEYNVLSILWSNTANKWFDIVTNASNYPLVEKKPELLLFDVNGLPRQFPPVVTTNSNGSHYTMVFNDNAEKKKFLTMLVLKYGDWKYDVTDLATTESISPTQL